MRKNCLLFLISLMITLTIAEFFLRIFFPVIIKQPEKPKTDWALAPERIWVEHHPLLGWYHQKNKDAILKAPRFTVPIHTNSAGLRSEKDYTPAKPEGTRRIAVMGDSFVFGFGVSQSESFPGRLEKAGANLEVLNLGVPGYGIDQIYLAYTHIAALYHPDVVIVGIFPEDFWRATRSFADTGHGKPYFFLTGDGTLELKNTPVPEQFKLNTGQFPELYEYGGIQHLLMKSFLYRLVRHVYFQLGKSLEFVDPDLSDEWILGRAILDHFVADIKASGAKPILVLIPPQQWVTSPRKPSLEKSLIRYAQRTGVDFLDLTPVFYEAIKDKTLTDYYIEGDWHWTALGHQLAAQAIQEVLTQKGIHFTS